MTDPTPDWLRSEMQDARERAGNKFPSWSDSRAALSVLDRIGTKLADADLDTLFDALDRLEEACGPEVVEVLGELRDAALRQRQGREGAR